jgi:hypothetical protein
MTRCAVLFTHRGQQHEPLYRTRRHVKRVVKTLRKRFRAAASIRAVSPDRATPGDIAALYRP